MIKLRRRRPKADRQSRVEPPTIRDAVRQLRFAILRATIRRKRWEFVCTDFEVDEVIDTIRRARDSRVGLVRFKNCRIYARRDGDGQRLQSTFTPYVFVVLHETTMFKMY